MAGADLPAHVDAAATGQPHVEHGDVRLARGDAPQRLVGRGRLADDGDVRFRLQQVAQATTYQLVIIQQEDPDAFATCHGSQCAVTVRYSPEYVRHRGTIRQLPAGNLDRDFPGRRATG